MFMCLGHNLMRMIRIKKGKIRNKRIISDCIDHEFTVIFLKDRRKPPL